MLNIDFVFDDQQYLGWKWSYLSLDAAAAAEEVVVVEVDGRLLGRGHLLLHLHLVQARRQLDHLYPIYHNKYFSPNPNLIVEVLNALFSAACQAVHLPVCRILVSWNVRS